MQCTNCGKFLDDTDLHYRAGWNKVAFCSRMCVQEMYKDLFAKDEIDKTIEVHNCVTQNISHKSS